MAKRELIFDIGPVEPCGDRWQVWVEGRTLHIGAACRRCQAQILEVVKLNWPALPVTEGD